MSRDASIAALSTEQAMKQEIYHNIFLKQSFLQRLTPTETKDLFDNFYWIIYQYIKRQYYNRISTSSTRKPFFIGLSAPQGSGKTTFTELMEQFFASERIKLIYMSLDDFYLPGDEQEKLQQSFPENNLLKYRGNAGTHDVDLLYRTLLAIKRSRCPEKENDCEKREDIVIPRYDKSLRNGLGDRVPIEHWPRIKDPIDIVLFEGWMLGFTAKETITLTDTATAIQEYQRLYPLTETAILHESITDLNSKLREYSKIHRLFDSWIIYQVQDINIVFTWRLQAEHAMKNMQKKGLSDEQVQDFVARFMPAYHTYLKDLYQNGPDRDRDSCLPLLRVEIDSNRKPFRFKTKDQEITVNSFMSKL